ncbi:hypothetical protein ACLKA7_016963 [Drosophila subpalustris]
MLRCMPQLRLFGLANQNDLSVQQVASQVAQAAKLFLHLSPVQTEQRHQLAKCSQCKRNTFTLQHNSAKITTRNKMEQERLIKPTVSYHLFLYREELARRNARQLRLSRTKIEITDKLISRTVKNIKTCSMDDLKAVNRELIFKRKLRRNVSKLRKEAKLAKQ